MNSIHRPTKSLDRSTPWTTTTLRWRTLARSDPSRSTRLDERAGVLRRDREELERDVAAERVAGAIDPGESALADRFEDRQRSPCRRQAARVDERLDLGLRVRRRVGIAIDARERSEDAQLGEHGAFVVARAPRPLRCPSRSAGPRRSSSQREQARRPRVVTVVTNVIFHRPSPSPVARARGESPRAPHSPTACRAPAPLPRGSCPTRSARRWRAGPRVSVCRAPPRSAPRPRGRSRSRAATGRSRARRCRAARRAGWALTLRASSRKRLVSACRR